MKNALFPQVTFLGIPCNILVGHYGNNRSALRLVAAKDFEDVIKGEPMATATINVPSATVAANEVILKDHDENEGMTEVLQEAGIVGIVKRSIQGYPVCDLLISPVLA